MRIAALVARRRLRIRAARAIAGARAQPLPIFDAHLHYNDEAQRAVSRSRACSRCSASTACATILATSRPNDGTRALVDAARRSPSTRAARRAVHPPVPQPRRPRDLVPRPGDLRADRAGARARHRLARHRRVPRVRCARTPARREVKRIVDLAVARGLWLHAHCDEAALEALYRARSRACASIWAHSGFGVPPDRHRAVARPPPVARRRALVPLRRHERRQARRGVARAVRRAIRDRFVLGSDTWINERWASYGEILADLPRLARATAARRRAAIAHRNGERLFARAVTARSLVALASRSPAPLAHAGPLYRVERAGIEPSFLYGTLHSADPRVTALAPDVREALGALALPRARARAARGRPAGFDAGAATRTRAGWPTISTPRRSRAIRAALGPRAPTRRRSRGSKPWAVMLMLARAADDDAADARRGRPRRGAASRPHDHRARAARRAGRVARRDPDREPGGARALDARRAATRSPCRARGDGARVARAATSHGSRAIALDAGRARRADRGRTSRRCVRHLVDDRSALMAHRLYLPLRGGRVFVAVGALHLDGPRRAARADARAGLPRAARLRAARDEAPMLE